jgi:pimeloyl-ACP methyl ester carboxylesterase
LRIVTKRIANHVRFFGPLVEKQMQATANNIVISEVFEKCGHSLALEQPERLANLLKKFIL